MAGNSAGHLAYLKGENQINKKQTEDTINTCSHTVGQIILSVGLLCCEVGGGMLGIPKEIRVVIVKKQAGSSQAGRAGCE